MLNGAVYGQRPFDEHRLVCTAWNVENSVSHLSCLVGMFAVQIKRRPYFDIIVQKFFPVRSAERIAVAESGALVQQAVECAVRANQDNMPGLDFSGFCFCNINKSPGILYRCLIVQSRTFMDAVCRTGKVGYSSRLQSPVVSRGIKHLRLAEFFNDVFCQKKQHLGIFNGNTAVGFYLGVANKCKINNKCKLMI